MSVRSPEPRPETAWLSFCLLAANVALFVLASSRAGTAFAMQLPAPVLLELGANVAPFTQFAGHWENLCTSIFLHGGVVHLLFNLVALQQVGPFVERTVGRARFAVMYVVAGLGASLATMLASNYGAGRAGIAVGASGAICGLIGGAAVLGFRIEGKSSPLARSMLRWLAFTLVFGYVVSLGAGVRIDNNAHLGGAVVGAACALAFRRSVSYSPFGRAARVVVCAMVCVAAFGCKLRRAEPAWTQAKIDCVSGQHEAARLELDALGVKATALGEIVRRCERPR